MQNINKRIEINFTITNERAGAVRRCARAHKRTQTIKTIITNLCHKFQTGTIHALTLTLTLGRRLPIQNVSIDLSTIGLTLT